MASKLSPITSSGQIRHHRPTFRPSPNLSRSASASSSQPWLGQSPIRPIHGPIASSSTSAPRPDPPLVFRPILRLPSESAPPPELFGTTTKILIIPFFPFSLLHLRLSPLGRFTTAMATATTRTCRPFLALPPFVPKPAIFFKNGRVPRWANFLGLLLSLGGASMVAVAGRGVLRTRPPPCRSPSSAASLLASLPPCCTTPAAASSVVVFAITTAPSQFHLSAHHVLLPQFPFELFTISMVCFILHFEARNSFWLRMDEG